jgi:hypothetical protein
LVLRPDGTFDQTVISNDGKRMYATGQHWQYYPDKDRAHIWLDKRLEFFIPEAFGKQRGEGVLASEMLIVELESGGEPVIVLNPDWDCVYAKVENRTL